MQQAPAFPNPAETGAVLATVNDWRAILLLAAFLLSSLVVFTIWREILNWRLAKAMDGIRDALTALKIVIVENAAEQRGRASMQDRRQDRQERRQNKQDHQP